MTRQFKLFSNQSHCFYIFNTPYYMWPLFRFRKVTKWVVYNVSEVITETTVIVQRLTKNEEYSFRVAAVNEVGQSEFSDQSDFIKVSLTRNRNAISFQSRLFNKIHSFQGN